MFCLSKEIIIRSLDCTFSRCISCERVRWRGDSTSSLCQALRWSVRGLIDPFLTYLQQSTHLVLLDDNIYIIPILPLTYPSYAYPILLLYIIIINLPKKGRINFLYYFEKCFFFLWTNYSNHKPQSKDSLHSFIYHASIIIVLVEKFYLRFFPFYC